jgi:hypothetical protein
MSGGGGQCDERRGDQRSTTTEVEGVSRDKMAIIAETEKAKKEKEKRRRAEKKKVLITMVELGWWEVMPGDA